MEFYRYDHEITMSDIGLYKYNNTKIGVLAHMTKMSGDILLQQRGRKSRDDNYLFEEIGGQYEETDINFRNTLKREIIEEAGNDIEFVINNSLGIYHCYKKSINWLFVVYSVKYINGFFKIMEPEKCIGYKFFNYEDAISSELVSESCRCLIKNIGNSDRR